MKRIFVVLFLFLFSLACWGQNVSSTPIKARADGAPEPKANATPKAPHKKNGAKKAVVMPAPVAGASQQEVDALQRALSAQEERQRVQFDTLTQSNSRLSEQLQQAQRKLSEADAKISNLESQIPASTKLESQVTAVKNDLVTVNTAIAEQKKKTAVLESPLGIRYKGVNIAPGGFFAAEALYRRNAENADINTSWNSIPWSNSSAAKLSEFRATARQTRLSLKDDGDAGKSKLTGYIELDFLRAGYGASETVSNGFSDRIRQLWGRVSLPGGWTFSGGQMWSLINTNRKGIDNLTEWTTMTPDGTQFLGHDYARQTAFRVVKSLDGSKVAVAVAAENAATTSVVPSNVPTSVSSLIAGLSTTGTGALSNTTYSTNLAPDLIAKVAVDPGYGHYEVKALGRFFRDRIISTATTAGHTNTVLGGAIGGAVRLPVQKQIDLTAETMWGNVGRYGATGTDAIVKPNGDLSPEKALHFLGAIETHPTPKLDLYFIGSGEYLYRNHGYGLPSIDTSKCYNPESTFSCSANVKSLTGGSTGIWYTFVKGPFGNVRYGLNYSYIQKSSWSGTAGAPKATESQIETSFRYYLP